MMSHEELLNTLNSKQFMDSRTPETPYFALRAVVELHQPRDYDGWKIGGNWCVGCNADFEYPCPTIQAIERELG